HGSWLGAGARGRGRVAGCRPATKCARFRAGLIGSAREPGGVELGVGQSRRRFGAVLRTLRGRTQRSGDRDETLTALAHDSQLLNGSPPPRFPAALLLKERRYLRAVEAGEAADPATAQAALAAAIEALLGTDRQRLRDLD